MKTLGDAEWSSYPSFLESVIPRMREFLDAHGIRATVFLVGRDAEDSRHRSLLSSFAADGHEIGNHSYHHDQWLHLMSIEEINADLDQSEGAIESATGRRPVAYRGPGYSINGDLIRLLSQRGYVYDASLFPNSISPLVRFSHFRRFKGSEQDRQNQKNLYGRFRDSLNSIKPFAWSWSEGSLLEVPLTTLPALRIPFHPTYLFYLAEKSIFLARRYFDLTILALRSSDISPVLLLHPTDFIGAEDKFAPSRFPGLTLRVEEKRSLLDEWFSRFQQHYTLGTIEQLTQSLHIASVKSRSLDQLMSHNR